jgi:transcriptional regulator with XRE-family HTH domain
MRKLLTIVGERIRMGRLIAKLSQTELADKIGVTFQQVQKYEKGVNRVGAGRLQRVAEALGQADHVALRR